MVVVSHFLIGFCLFRVAAAMSLLVAGTCYSLCITGGVILATEVPAAMLLLHSWVLRRWMVFQGLHCACHGDLKCLDHLRTFHNATTSDPAPLKTKSLCTLPLIRHFALDQSLKLARGRLAYNHFLHIILR